MSRSGAVTAPLKSMIDEEVGTTMRSTRFAVMLFAIFALDAVAASAPVFTSLYSFGGYAHDAAEPESQLAIGPHGALYGATNAGGTYGSGTVFSLTPPGTPGGW